MTPARRIFSLCLRTAFRVLPSSMARSSSRIAKSATAAASAALHAEPRLDAPSIVLSWAAAKLSLRCSCLSGVSGGHFRVNCFCSRSRPASKTASFVIARIASIVDMRSAKRALAASLLREAKVSTFIALDPERPKGSPNPQCACVKMLKAKGTRSRCLLPIRGATPTLSAPRIRVPDVCACRSVPQNEAVSRGGDREDAFATFGQNRNPHGVANPLRQFSVQLELECVQFFAGI